MGIDNCHRAIYHVLSLSLSLNVPYLPSSSAYSFYQYFRGVSDDDAIKVCVLCLDPSALGPLGVCIYLIYISRYVATPHTLPVPILYIYNYRALMQTTHTNVFCFCFLCVWLLWQQVLEDVHHSADGRHRGDWEAAPRGSLPPHCAGKKKLRTQSEMIHISVSVFVAVRCFKSLDRLYITFHACCLSHPIQGSSSTAHDEPSPWHTICTMLRGYFIHTIWQDCW